MSKPCIIRVVGEGRDKFEKAISLAMTLGDYDMDKPRRIEGFIYINRDNDSSHWRPVETRTPGSYLCLLDYISEHKSNYIHKLPFPIERVDVPSFLWSYVNRVEHADEEPDTDGSNELGWDVCNADSLRLYSEVGLLVAARPYWITYGK